jgi:N-acetylglucosaminyldiphosphoundecaprenol N-acetyl-beta-D-mannosaminyltransferase
VTGERRVRLFGVEMDALDMPETVAAVARIVEEGPPTQHVAVNAAKAVMMRDDDAIRSIVADAGLVSADGQAVVWASRVLGAELPERVAGIDLFGHLIALAAERGYGVYLLGARQDVVAKTSEILCGRHPALKVSGARDGYFSEEESDEVVLAVRESGADMLFVAMPSPQKEFWVAENLPGLGVSFAMGVGGTFDVIAGVTERAPRWMQRAGLEWFYRFVQEPGRMWRRYLVGNTRFLALDARERLRGSDSGRAGR